MAKHTVSMRATLPAIAVFAALAASTLPAQAAHRDGKQVVDAACGACHNSGKDGAPKIGDAAAWANRAGQGLSALTKHAIDGVRKMPAHGGDMGVSDQEITRAIVYMVNNSGGNWIEPISVRHLEERNSKIVVQSACASCHEPGTGGAPKIGDRAAWTPRLAKGLDTLVASAVNGHGGMPPRGGMPGLERDELRGAILYMFNYGLPPVQPAEMTAKADPRHKITGGMDVYFGVMPAAAVRAGMQSTGTKVPSGKDVYHVNISLSDSNSHAAVPDALVTVRVSDGMTLQTKTLHPVVANKSVSYGEFFRLSSGSAYNIQTEIRRKAGAEPVVANFEYRAP